MFGIEAITQTRDSSRDLVKLYALLASVCNIDELVSGKMK